ncbi:sugar porter family MFS transporter [Verrucomicrobiaceae bacterium 5K15]|uniref:Sugar porter family MFS transporter n=1 Tax=Oceaniferula flava TaxID=2800421 RepID=A0AAE2V7J1_9BACT|nr:sugar porter family MFS transporter [Oceaniferula flavus]MBK1853872.1 sugar porter family MFS transporter [Oceaniferula flavus]MBM1135178.1 sugar porter family MFS transporter [Oceaniferula flavus]
MNKLLFWSITSALAGFLFGFDTVVISGAEQRIQELWGLSDMLHGFAIGAALYGTVIGALIGGWPTDRFGRKQTLLWIGVLYLVSAIGSALAPDVYSFIAARFIGGLGVGISTIAAPLYISEIAPADKRGRLTGMFQFNIVFGILIAFLSNALISDVGEDAWRWMLGVEAFPALVYALMCRFIPESPRWLIGNRGDREEASRILREVDPSASAESVDLLVDEIQQHYHQQTSRVRRPFWVKKLKAPILLALLIAFFNQLSGINAILYFAPRIFEMTGLGEKAALLQSTGIGVTNLVFTFVGLWMIDRMGRRVLLYIGSVGYILSLGLVAWAFQSEHYSIVPACIFAFIAAHAIGQGAVIWVFIAEIFPNEYRARGQSLGCSTHWVFAALLTTFFPKMVTAFAPATVFAFFAGMMVLQLIWVWLMVPETKGISLESLEDDLVAER